ncbi:MULTISPECIES: carbon-nitrogen hydrolase family protein [Pseudofrankia]|uniref:carbon-nitrogen hydrolase family protein n=1 Tax=Pseudofrankia TaxID=2994363 RepID=UPI000234D60B|nr:MULTISPECIES: carbon-nitrogen hydrolase family protein [Pseudofrankia]OHV35616.1 amidohydrolase [Pseudofrankia sp. EUN1h]
MTANKAFKQRVRERARRTGESYTAALRHFRQPSEGTTMPNTNPFRISVAQLDAPTDPRDAEAFQRVGHDVRRLMTEARDQGARLIHFCEGALCSPNKRILSSDPTTMADADWSRFDWAAQRGQLEAIRKHAAALRLWTVVGAVHRLTEPHRPHNSLYVIDDHGHIITRYDERMLSNTKVSYLYTPGISPITFDVDEVRFGCALGMESVYPELFAEYERADVHCVLLSTMDNGTTFGLQTQAHASTNSYWISYATVAVDAAAAPSGIAGPDGHWATRCGPHATSAIATVDIDREHESLARPWRRTARAGRYATAVVDDDPRAQRSSL